MLLNILNTYMYMDIKCYHPVVIVSGTNIVTTCTVTCKSFSLVIIPVSSVTKKVASCSVCMLAAVLELSYPLYTANSMYCNFENTA